MIEDTDTNSEATSFSQIQPTDLTPLHRLKGQNRLYLLTTIHELQFPRVITGLVQDYLGLFVRRRHRPHQPFLMIEDTNTNSAVTDGDTENPSAEETCLTSTAQPSGSLHAEVRLLMAMNIPTPNRFIEQINYAAS